MELSKLKNMIRENGDKVIIMENDEPELVIMSFAEYEKLARLRLPDQIHGVRARSNPHEDHAEVRDVDSDRTRETEFLTPIDTGPIRTASISGYDRPMKPEREREDSTTRMADIRLEDLPI